MKRILIYALIILLAIVIGIALSKINFNNHETNQVKTVLQPKYDSIATVVSTLPKDSIHAKYEDVVSRRFKKR